MAKTKTKGLVPHQTYDFDLVLGKKPNEVSLDLYKLTILTSIDVPYQTFIMELVTEPNTFILDQIYGQKPIKLVSKLLATDNFVQERIEFDLMYLSSDLSLDTRVQIPNIPQVERRPLTIIAVARKAYKTMNTFVNNVAQGQSITSAIQTIVSRTGATLKMDTSGRNTETIDQILVPPSTLYKCLRYINRTFGIFNGMPAIYCDYDNVIHIKNLTSKMKTSHTFTVHQLALNVDNTDIIQKRPDGKVFYTLRDIDTSYKGNSVFAVLAPLMVFITKPKDRLQQQIAVDLESFCQSYGLISDSNKIFFDKEAITSDSRISYHKDHTGYELSDSFINANYSKNIGHISEMSIVVEQSMRILRLMEVGEAVQFSSKITDTNDLTGKYILRRSEISFTRTKDWSSTALLTLIRTNRAIN